MKSVCICCETPIEKLSEAINWVDSRVKLDKDGNEDKKHKMTYIIHMSCFNKPSYKGLHQNIEPGKYD